jgi:RNA polymerase sigma-70 factor, ECF subfamily
MLTREQITSALLRHQLALTAFIASVARSYHLAEDVFQEVCMNAIGHQESFESEQHLLNWARLNGRHRAIDALRARDGKFDGLSEEVLDQLGTAFETNRLANYSEKHDALRECIQSLTPNNYEILRLRYFEGRTSAAIAKLLDRKLETVYQSVARIHKSLGDCISNRLLEIGNR